MVRYLTYTGRLLVLLAPVVACTSTTRNTANGDGAGGAAGETFTATDSGGSGGTSQASTSSGGTDQSDSGGSSGDTGGASSTSQNSGANGGSGSDSTSGGAGSGSGGTGGASTDGTDSNDTTGDSCSDDGTCSTQCPCDTGEGACSNDDECAPGHVCTAAAVAKLGFSDGAKSCMPEHCDNDAFDSDAGETSQDCGGECGCRATYEQVEFEGLSDDIDIVYLLDMSGDGSTLVGNARDEEASTSSMPIVVSASGAVTFLENFGAYGGASLVNDDGSIIGGTLNCDDPPGCTDGWGLPFWWSGDASPVSYPFATAAVAMSASGNVVVYTEYGTDPERAYRLVTSTGASTYHSDLSNAYGVSGNGLVVYGTLVANANNHGVWYTQTDEVWTPPYPGDWGGGASILGMNNDGSVLVGEGRVWVDEANVDFFPFVSQDQSFELVEITDARLIDVRPADMSGDGSRFVGTGYNQDTSTNEAVFWDEAGGLRTLYDELVARGLEFPIDVTELAPAQFISSNGRVLVGSGGSFVRPFWRVVLAD